jgi:hypothetical protein
VETVRPVCDKNCFSCIYEDCVYDDLDYEDYSRGDAEDKRIRRENGLSVRGLLTAEERKAKRRAGARARYWRLKEERLARHTSVFECGNENVLRHWKEWRRKKGG